ncbi:cbb3-type cytochrome c oxidase subunit 3 [Phaeobacter sp. J2-8]|uniref:cbb3-type cytochrome c oxidase subunit 3 n=1 Tax=Phaeobacter sp. J2-8 TaxID=2931394 RepID=UPI0032AF19D9
MMDTYTLLREVADSWVLLAMFLFFLGVMIWAYLPSQSAARTEAQMIPFRDDDAQASLNSDLNACPEGSQAMVQKGQSDGR